MIKFFKHIRKSMIKENRTSKYLLYAIGEIILVVIGILIALQINTWNEHSKTNVKEQALLIALKQELTTNRKELNRIIEVNRKRNEGAHQLASVLSPKISTSTEIEISKLWYNTFAREAVYKPSLGVINEAISSGSLSIIKNSKIRDFFASMESELQLLKSQEETVFNWRMQCFQTTRELGNVRILLFNTLEPEVAEKLGESSFENSNMALVQSKTFENDIVFFIGTTNHLQTGFLLPLQLKMNDAMTLLNTELHND
ncbi:DUF6090 family protein [Rasiella sp. SM2506]|uniref:DUF6090 family protein n=1 Tax=Rasiella sp. SM2506 TaxID=3423914 RepID=UPI003D7BE152